jgi:hypothetical protein
MAKQKGIMPFTGSLGKVTGRQVNGEFILQTKSTLTAERVKTDPKFAGSRKMYNEFGLANKGSKMLRKVFKTAILDCYDNKLRDRLVKKLRKMITEDPISSKGERNLLCGNIGLLNGFWWNKNISISHAIATDYKVSVDRKSGIVKFHIPSFVPKYALTGMINATHYRIIASAAEMNWKEDGPLAKLFTTDYMPFNEVPTTGMDWMIVLSEESTLPIISCLSIVWYQEIAGEKELLRDLSYNTAGIVDVNVV